MIVRNFNLADVLTVTTGVSVGDGKMQTVRDITYWMLGKPTGSHVSDLFILPLVDRAIKEIYAQHPSLAKVEKPDFSGLSGDELSGAIKFWVKAQQKAFGRETVPLAQNIDA